MADNKDKKILNVPALRFPEFTDEWQHILNKELFNPVSDKNKDKIITLILSASQTEGMIERNNIGIDIKFDENSVKNYKIVRTGDYVVHLRSFQGGFAFSELTGICSPAYTILRPNKQLQYGFLRAYFMSKKFIDSLRLVTYGIRDGKSISVEEWMQLYTNIPSDKEQDKIIKLFNILDERIKLQNKIIEKLETLIKGIRDYVLNNKLQNTTKKKLGELCTITTGKLDANAMKSEGLYPFFTCAEDVYRIDSFAFDTEALLVSGNGANLGYIHYYKGKFNAYQRTYVLSNFIEDIHYIQIYLEAYLHKRIALEKSTSNTPYIVLATLAEMPIIIPSIKIQKDISNKILILKSKLITEIYIHNCYKDMRQFLLSQMFI